MKVKHLFLIMVLLATLLVLAACTNTSPSSDIDKQPSEDIVNTTVIEPPPNKSETTPTVVQEDSIHSLELEDHLQVESGKLVYTVTDAWIVKDIVDIPSEETFSTTGCWQVIDGKLIHYLFTRENDTSNHTVDPAIQYSSIVKDDGSFVDNAYIVMVAVDIENQDAVALQDHGGFCFNDDPYVFTADVFSLINTEDTHKKGYYGNAPFLFSEYGKYGNPHFPFLYKLEPGEKMSVTIGFLTGGYKISDYHNTNAELLDLSKFCLCVTRCEYDSPMINLSLE